MDNVELLRELLGDPSSDIISDTMLEKLLEEEGDDLNYAAAKACRIIARKFSLKAKKSLGRVSKDYVQNARIWLDMAEEFEDEAGSYAKPITAGLYESQKENERKSTDRNSPFFDENMSEGRYK